MAEEKKIPPKASVIERWGSSWAASAEKWMPDPFLFAIILVFIIFIMGMVIQHMNPYALTECMYKGFWAFLAFAMQMCIILMTGYAIAYHPAVHRGLIRLCGWPKNGKQAAALVAAVGTILAWVNWGLGLIVGALMAREMGRQAYFRKIPVHYPVLCAAGYAGLGLIWHYGLSASAPLLMTVEKHFLWELTGEAVIPVNMTIFSGYAIGMSVLVLLFAVGICYLLHPKPERCRGIEQYAPELIGEEAKEEKPVVVSVADKIENNRWIAILMMAIMVGSMVWWFATKGFMKGLDLNSINFIFVLIGLALYHNPIAYLRTIVRAAAVVGGIILQFPFYAGIQGVMMYSGLGVTIARWLARAATPFLWPAACWFIAGIINIFIPSGGGEWMTIGEILTRVTNELGVPIGKTIIAYASGDAWTNLANPFWAIPLLAITRMRVRDVFGYPLTICAISMIVFFLGLTFIPY